MIRRIIACSRPHGFIGVPCGHMHGTEILVASGETEAQVEEKLAVLVRWYGWTRREDGQWQCDRHDYKPDPNAKYTVCKMTAQQTNGVERFPS